MFLKRSFKTGLLYNELAYRPIIKIINTAIINEKALFQAPTFLKMKKKKTCLTRNFFSLYLFFPSSLFSGHKRNIKGVN